MKRGTIVGIVVAVVLIGGVGAAVAISAAGGMNEAAPAASASATSLPAEDESPAAEATTPADDQAEDETDDAATAAGTYAEYSDAALAASEGTTVLFFHAPWCPQCRALESDILGEGVPDGVTIFKVDYDSRQDLRQKYGVTLQTTVVEVDSDGEKVASYVAYEEPTLAAVAAGLGL